MVCDETVVTVTDDCVLVADIDGSETTTGPCVRDVDGPGTGQAGGGWRIPTGRIIPAPVDAWC